MSVLGLPWWALAVLGGLAALAVFELADITAAVVSRRRHRPRGRRRRSRLRRK